MGGLRAGGAAHPCPKFDLGGLLSRCRGASLGDLGRLVGFFGGPGGVAPSVGSCRRAFSPRTASSISDSSLSSIGPNRSSSILEQLKRYPVLSGILFFFFFFSYFKLNVPLHICQYLFPLRNREVRPPSHVNCFWCHSPTGNGKTKLFLVPSPEQKLLSPAKLVYNIRV